MAAHAYVLFTDNRGLSHQGAGNSAPKADGLAFHPKSRAASAPLNSLQKTARGRTGA